MCFSAFLDVWCYSKLQLCFRVQKKAIVQVQACGFQLSSDGKRLLQHLIIQAGKRTATNQDNDPTLLMKRYIRTMIISLKFVYMMKIFFKFLCAIACLAPISNSFTIGIRPMVNPKLIINSPSPNGFAKASAEHGIESVISMLVELQIMKEMLNSSLDNE